MYKRTDDKNDKNDESQRRLKTLFNFIFLVQTFPLSPKSTKCPRSVRHTFRVAWFFLQDLSLFFN